MHACRLVCHNLQAGKLQQPLAPAPACPSTVVSANTRLHHRLSPLHTDWRAVRPHHDVCALLGAVPGKAQGVPRLRRPAGLTLHPGAGPGEAQRLDRSLRRHPCATAAHQRSAALGGGAADQMTPRLSPLPTSAAPTDQSAFASPLPSMAGAALHPAPRCAVV